MLRNPEEWKQIISEAQPIIFHVLNTLSAGQNLNDPKTKSEIAARILPLVNDVPNPVERDAYRQQVARVLQVDESALLLLSSRKKRRRRSYKDKETEDQRRSSILRGTDLGSQENIHAMEKYIIQYMAKDPTRFFASTAIYRAKNLSEYRALIFNSANSSRYSK